MRYIAKEEHKDDVVSMTKADLEKVISAKVEEVRKQSESDAKELEKELVEKANATIKEEIAKAEANRKSIEDSGLDSFGEEVDNNTRIVAKMEKSGKENVFPLGQPSSFKLKS